MDWYRVASGLSVWRGLKLQAGVNCTCADVHGCARAGLITSLITLPPSCSWWEHGVELKMLPEACKSKIGYSGLDIV